MIKQFNYKQFGSIDLAVYDNTAKSMNTIEDHIKIIFIPQKYGIKVDFQEFSLPHDALLFVNPQVVIQPLNIDLVGAELIHFNRDFYCIEIHDQEVACDGILYNNVFEVPFIELDENQSKDIQKIITDVKFEMQSQDASTEEMLRILLKLIILKSTRIWKQQHQLAENEQYLDVQFLRKFSKLVEQHYKTHHTVADYADMLSITPKSLSKKIGLLSKDTPNDIIKNRIILESKRLLAHTSLSVKEIAYSLNYEDDAYFVRFFTKNTGTSPTSFRKQF
ncbi:MULTISPECIES: helix-turn-helix domain-containing protein [unclassified Arcicella]|uniref:helix-turn-helix domain-containing protein n=1 Tax=unclassified Arcicella TaxID=2644986 RepID=UPI00285D70A8|nr:MULTISPECIES: helix-turn-helix domain-containing protein [unclassified Arcicella]MDR6561558.1 AraC-like DNA-binding protein [Arcicella sp. BE51]MDR6811442.1 AraC-like DNA-binding protein [Arcicella sp. BE140]MDR6822792.1 AraC-like DNA-binding protein [Arcicella sp. BE139]